MAGLAGAMDGEGNRQKGDEKRWFHQDKLGLTGLKNGDLPKKNDDFMGFYGDFMEVDGIYIYLYHEMILMGWNADFRLIQWETTSSLMLVMTYYKTEIY